MPQNTYNSLQTSSRQTNARQRRSGRLRLQLPIDVSGTDVNSQVFCMPGKVRTMSHYGAEIRLDCALMPEQEINVSVPATGNDQPARVVKLVADGEEGYSYGIEFLDPVENYWNIPMPGVALTGNFDLADTLHVTDVPSEPEIQNSVTDPRPELLPAKSAPAPQLSGKTAHATREPPAVIPTPSEERVFKMLRVRVRGVDNNGNRFFQSTSTIEISRKGGRLVGLSEVAYPGSIIVISRSFRKAKFRVVWVGITGTRQTSQIGVECLESEKNLWGIR